MQLIKSTPTYGTNYLINRLLYPYKVCLQNLYNIVNVEI